MVIIVYLVKPCRIRTDDILKNVRSLITSYRLHFLKSFKSSWFLMVNKAKNDLHSTNLRSLKPLTKGRP